MNIIVSALDSNEFLKVSECSYAKEMWNTLEEYHKNPRSTLMDKEESRSSQAVGNKNCQDSSVESEEEKFSLLFKKFSKFLKKRNNKSDSGMIARNLLSLTLTNIHALDVVNRVIIKLNVPTRKENQEA